MTKREKIYEYIEEVVENTLLEFRKKNAKVLVDNREVDFGCPEHINDMVKTLNGLERIRDCFQAGSGNRLMYAQACSRLKRLIKSLADKEEHVEGA